MQLVILCGGLGTRLKKISKNQPKGLLKINGKFFLEHLIESVLPHDFYSLHFCLGHKSDQYINFLNKKKYNFKYTYSIEKENNLLGTGGAIKNAIPNLKDNFVLQYGDTILNIDYSKFYSEHLKNKKDMSMSIISSQLSSEIPNVFCRNIDNEKYNCIYKKKFPPKDANFIDYGAIIFRRSIFEKIKKMKFDLSEVQQTLSSRQKAFFYEVKNPYIEIGNPNSYEKAFKLLQ